VLEAILPEGGVLHLPRLLVDSPLHVESASAARRLIEGGAVKIDGQVVREIDLARDILEGKVVQAGKRRFVRFRSA
jgi:tyrosyl-tRNA synthetase